MSKVGLLRISEIDFDPRTQNRIIRVFGNPDVRIIRGFEFDSGFRSMSRKEENIDVFNGF